jgi:flagellar basal-body rod modification protein FlgD
MQVNATTSTSASGTTSTADRLPIQTLGQNDFLKLLATQMSSQNPLQPMTDTNFMGQMVQFSMLQQNQGMQNDLSQLRSDQQLGQASALLGKKVTWTDAKGVSSSGVVSGIQIAAGVPQVVVNGQTHGLDEITGIGTLATQK